VIEVEVSFKEKLATVRYDPEKVRLEEILKRYAGTRYRVAPSHPLAAVVRRDGVEVRARADDLRTPAAVLVDFLPRGGSRFTLAPEATIVDPAAVPGLKAAGSAEPVIREGSSAEDPVLPRSLRFPLEREGRLQPGGYSWQVRFRFALAPKAGAASEVEGTIRAPLVLLEGAGARPSPGSQPALPALVGGSFELAFGHLCDATGCVEHLRKSLEGLDALVGVRPRFTAGEAWADLLARAGEAVEVSGLRERLRERSIEALAIVPRGFRQFQILLERGAHCPVCRDRSIAAALSVPWASGVAAEGDRLRILSFTREPDLAALLDALDRAGVPARALWLVPEGVPAPPAAAPPAPRSPAALLPGGSRAQPAIRFDLDHECEAGAGLVDLLEWEVWPSGVALERDRLGGPAVLATMRERRHADLVPALRSARSGGLHPRRIRLSGFGDLRLQIEFEHLCGEVEYSKPPERKREGKEGGDGKEEKPFVPQPLRPASSSPARMAIEKALAGVRWMKEGSYREYHTRPEFDGPRSLALALEVKAGEEVPLDPLFDALAQAGFPPTALRVSRLFPGLSFGALLPGDVEITDAGGAMVSLRSLGRPGRPLALVFTVVKLTQKDKKKYEAEPRDYWRLRETIRAFVDRADFAVVSSNPEDSLPEVAGFLKRAGIEVPILQDPSGQARSVLNAQLTPPPHIYLFDGEGRLRYAGDPHDRWDRPDQPHRDYLARALERVLGGKVEDNHAAFYNSPKCDCSHPGCKCPKCGCGPSCRCAIGHCKVGF